MEKWKCKCGNMLTFQGPPEDENGKGWEKIYNEPVCAKCGRADSGINDEGEKKMNWEKIKA